MFSDSDFIEGYQTKYLGLKKDKQEKEGMQQDIVLRGGNSPINDMVKDWVNMFRDGRCTMQDYRNRINAENGKEAGDTEDLPCPGSKIRSKGKGRGLGYGKGKGPIGKPAGEKEEEDEEKTAQTDEMNKKLLAAHIRDKLAANLPSLTRMTKNDLFTMLTKVAAAKRKKSDLIPQDRKPKVQTRKQIMEDEQKTAGRTMDDILATLRLTSGKFAGRLPGRRSNKQLLSTG